MLITGSIMMLLVGMLIFLGRKENKENILSKSRLEKNINCASSYVYRKLNQPDNIFLKWYQKITKKKQFFQREQVVTDLHTLEPVKPLKAAIEQYYIKKISVVLIIFFAGGILLVCVGLSEKVNPTIVDGKYIDRYPQGQGAQYLQLEAQVGEEEKEVVEITVAEKKYSEAELAQYSMQLIPLLEEIILGENASPDYITKDLHFVSHVEGYPFTLTYLLDNTDYLNQKGQLLEASPNGNDMETFTQWKQALKDGVVVNIVVKLQYEDFKEESTFAVKIFEKEITAAQKLKNQLTYLLMQSEQESSTQDRLELPQQVEGKQIVWTKKKSGTDMLLLLIIGVATVSMYMLKDNELHGLVLKRQNQLLRDYPEIVSKITLLTGAGLTVRNSFYRMAREYQRKREQGYEKHYAYEEIVLSIYEMENGIPEIQAYENFGKRCRTQQYIKLSALLVQNLKKSASGLFSILQEEATDAFDLRKSMAKKSGEEAGTKLLLPMIMMLGIVMMIIFYPAMTAFAS